MNDYLLYHMPGACSRVALNALEEIGLPYRDQGIALMRGEQYGPAFRAINPKCKIPVLIANGVTITETPAILYHLAGEHPAAGLLPAAADGSVMMAGLSDVSWIAGALHPLANRMFRPAAISAVDADAVKNAAQVALGDIAAIVRARLSAQPWWYGEHWSIADMFLAWVYGLATQSGFPLADHPALQDHGARVAARPSFIRARLREQAAVARDDLPLAPGIAL